MVEKIRLNAWVNLKAFFSQRRNAGRQLVDKCLVCSEPDNLTDSWSIKIAKLNRSYLFLFNSLLSVKINDPCKAKKNNCVAGRRNASVAPIVPAVAAAGAGAVAALAKEEETRFIAATSFFSIAKEVGNLLNGTDAEISKDEIFDLFVEPTSICEPPEKPK